MTRAIVGAAVPLAALVLLLVAERVWPLRERRRPVLRRVLTNVVVAVSAGAVAAGLIEPTATALLSWTGSQGFGLLQWLALPVAVEAVLGFLLLDLAFYWWHRANHRVPLLWRFHVVHHIDPDLDVTTAGRFHPGEMLWSVGFQAAQITLLGVPLVVYAAYGVVFQVATLFHHSNWRLPRPIERVLLVVFVTPRMHGIHHSQVRTETNQNFSVIFNLWDRLHRTLLLEVPQERIVIGVPGYDEPEDNDLGRVLAQPLRRQRQYWPERDEAQSASSRSSAR